jgi:hypothetical protein
MTKKRVTCEWRAPVIYPLDTLLANLKGAIARTEEYIPVRSGCRLYRWLAAIEELRRQDRRSVASGMARTIHAKLARARETGTPYSEGGDDLTELWDFPFRDSFRSLLDARIFTHVVDHLETKLRPMHWKFLVQGNLRPEDDGENTPHRDLLLELYVASAAEAAGMAVELAEPDIVLTLAGQKFGIAAKRIRSRKRVRPNAKKGSKQIEGSTAGRGLIFLDVSNLMNRDMAAMRYLRDFGTEDSGSVLGNLLKFASEEESICSLLEEPQVEGIILRHAVPAIFAKSFIPATLETWSPLVEQPSPLTVSVYGAMLDALSPPVNPQPGIGPSGWTACEFSYAHP